MKTNHQRQFVEKETRYVGKHKNGDRETDNISHLPGTKSFGEIAPLSQKAIGARANTHDTNNGKHGVGSSGGASGGGGGGGVGGGGGAG